MSQPEQTPSDYEISQAMWQADVAALAGNRIDEEMFWKKFEDHRKQCAAVIVGMIAGAALDIAKENP